MILESYSLLFIFSLSFYFLSHNIGNLILKRVKGIINLLSGHGSPPIYLSFYIYFSGILLIFHFIFHHAFKRRKYRKSKAKCRKREPIMIGALVCWSSGVSSWYLPSNYRIYTPITNYFMEKIMKRY